MHSDFGPPLVRRPGEGRSIDLGNFEMSVKASGAETAGMFALLEAAEPPSFGPPMHIHSDVGEAFYVLEGEYIVFLEERTFTCPAGSFIYVPPGLVHGFRVGDRPSRKLNLYTPAGMVGYFDELAAAIKRREADVDRLDEIAARHGMKVIGPVPQGYL